MAITVRMSAENSIVGRFIVSPGEQLLTSPKSGEVKSRTDLGISEGNEPACHQDRIFSLKARNARRFAAIVRPAIGPRLNVPLVPRSVSCHST